jgi:hypothetical protein
MLTSCRMTINIPWKVTSRVTLTTTPMATTVVSETNTITETEIQDTETFTTTLTETETNTVDATATVSVTATETTTSTTTPTVTISPGANFLPLASSAAYISAAGGVSRREVPLAFSPNRPVLGRAVPICPVGGNTRNPTGPRMYPASVECIEIKQVINFVRSTVTRSRTVTAPTATITQTTTITSTMTVPQNPASTTLTETTSTTEITTSTISTTTTSTETATSIVPAATPSTYFPQCQANNIRSRAGTKSFVSFYAFSSIRTSAGVASAEVCCQNCALDATCASFAWFRGGTCYMIASGADCSANPPPFVVSSQAINTGSDGYVVGNGNCGQVRVTGAL